MITECQWFIRTAIRPYTVVDGVRQSSDEDVVQVVFGIHLVAPQRPRPNGLGVLTMRHIWRYFSILHPYFRFSDDMFQSSTSPGDDLRLPFRKKAGRPVCERTSFFSKYCLDINEATAYMAVKGIRHCMKALSRATFESHVSLKMKRTLRIQMGQLCTTCSSLFVSERSFATWRISLWLFFNSPMIVHLISAYGDSTPYGTVHWLESRQN